MIAIRPLCLLLLSLLNSAIFLQASSVAPIVRLLPPGNHAGELIGEGGRAIVATPSLLVVGSPHAVRSLNGTSVATGAVYVFDSKNHRLIRTLFPADGVAGGQFGRALAVSGHVLVVGSPHWGTLLSADRGAVYVYNLATGALIRRIEPHSVNTGDLWGFSVAIEGDTVVYSARDHDGGTLSSNMGMVETFSLQRGTQMVAMPGVPFLAGRPPLSQLGASVSIHRGVVYAGAPGSSSGDGAVLLFDAENGDIIQTITDPKGTGKAGGFGYSLDVDDDFMVVGAPFHTINAFGPQPMAGSAYLFDIRNPGSSQAIIGSIDGAANQLLGSAVATRNGVSAVGVQGADFLPPGPGLGSAILDYGLVVMLDHRMRELDRRSTPTPGTGARFGNSVAVSAEGHVFAGAPGDDGGGSDSGAIWKMGPYKHDASGMFEVLAVSQTSAVPNATALYSNFDEVTASGRVSFIASLAGPGAAGGKNKSLWSTLQTGLGPALVAQTQVPAGEGMPPHVSEITPRKLFRPLSNSSLDLFFRVTDASGVTSQYHYDAYIATGLSRVIDTSTTTYPSLQNVAVKSLGETSVPFAGGTKCGIPLKLRPGTGMNPVTAASDSAIYTQGGFFIREGIDNLPAPGTGKHGEFIGNLAFADPVHCFFRGFIQDTTVSAGVFAGNSATLAVKGAQAPDALGAVTANSPLYDSFLGVTGLSGSMGRNYLFRATLKLDPAKRVTTANNEALYFDSNSTGIKQCARKGEAIPGTTLLWKRFLDFGITSQGHMLILATLSGPQVTSSNDTALVLRIPRFPLADATIVLLREGDLLPGGEGARVASISRVDMAFNATSSSYGALVAFKPEAGGAAPTNNLAWVMGSLNFSNSTTLSNYLPRVAFRKGMTVSAQPGRQTISSISVPALFRDVSGAGNMGFQHAVFSQTTQPSSVVVGSFPDKTKVILQR